MSPSLGSREGVSKSGVGEKCSASLEILLSGNMNFDS
jgi:hypothetical protein